MTEEEKEEEVVKSEEAVTELEKVNGAEIMINRANDAADRMEKANAEMRVLLEKREVAKVESTLSGETHAGKEPVVKSVEAESLEAAKKQLAGTGFEDMVE